MSSALVEKQTTQDRVLAGERSSRGNGEVRSGWGGGKGAES